VSSGRPCSRLFLARSDPPIQNPDRILSRVTTIGTELVQDQFFQPFRCVLVAVTDGVEIHSSELDGHGLSFAVNSGCLVTSESNSSGPEAMNHPRSVRFPDLWSGTFPFKLPHKSLFSLRATSSSSVTCNVSQLEPSQNETVRFLDTRVR